jgi:hypothetical protein
MTLDSNATLPLKIHAVKGLLLKVFTRNSPGYLQEPVGQCTLAVVNMSDYTEISCVFHSWFSSFMALESGNYNNASNISNPAFVLRRKIKQKGNPKGMFTNGQAQ